MFTVKIRLLSTSPASQQPTELRLWLLVTHVHDGAAVAALAGEGHHALRLAGQRQRGQVRTDVRVSVHSGGHLFMGENGRRHKNAINETFG